MVITSHAINRKPCVDYFEKESVTKLTQLQQQKKQ